MKTRAAVAWEKAKPLQITEINLEGPKTGEVLVEVKATGISHTDEFTLSGADPEGPQECVCTAMRIRSAASTFATASTLITVSAKPSAPETIVRRCHSPASL